MSFLIDDLDTARGDLALCMYTELRLNFKPFTNLKTRIAFP